MNETDGGNSFPCYLCNKVCIRRVILTLKYNYIYKAYIVKFKTVRSISMLSQYTIASRLDVTKYISFLENIPIKKLDNLILSNVILLWMSKSLVFILQPIKLCLESMIELYIILIHHSMSESSIII